MFKKAAVVILIVLSLLFLASCKKDDKEPENIIVINNSGTYNVSLINNKEYAVTLTGIKGFEKESGTLTVYTDIQNLTSEMVRFKLMKAEANGENCNVFSLDGLTSNIISAGASKTAKYTFAKSSFKDDDNIIKLVLSAETPKGDTIFVSDVLSFRIKNETNETTTTKDIFPWRTSPSSTNTDNKLKEQPAF